MVKAFVDDTYHPITLTLEKPEEAVLLWHLLHCDEETTFRDYCGIYNLRVFETRAIKEELRSIMNSALTKGNVDNTLKDKLV